MKVKFKIDDRAFQKALKDYSKVSSLSLGEVIKKRATRVFFELYKFYRKAAPTRQEIDAEAAARGYRVNVRPSARKGSRAKQVKRELSLRKRAINYTAMGWIVAAKQAGLAIKKNVLAKFKGGVKSEGKSKLSGNKPYVVLENTLIGASEIEKKSNIINRVLKSEAKDMRVYIERKTLKKKNKKFK